LHEAERAFLNILGCAVGGAQHPTVTIVDEALADATGSAQATLLGRGRRSDLAS
jgi:2-methylcitrate dehydratase PrpD